MLHSFFGLPDLRGDPPGDAALETWGFSASGAPKSSAGQCECITQERTFCSLPPQRQPTFIRYRSKRAIRISTPHLTAASTKAAPSGSGELCKCAPHAGLTPASMVVLGLLPHLRASRHDPHKNGDIVYFASRLVISLGRRGISMDGSCQHSGEKAVSSPGPVSDVIKLQLRHQNRRGVSGCQPWISPSALLMDASWTVRSCGGVIGGGIPVGSPVLCWQAPRRDITITGRPRRRRSGVLRTLPRITVERGQERARPGFQWNDGMGRGTSLLTRYVGRAGAWEARISRASLQSLRRAHLLSYTKRALLFPHGKRLYQWPV